MPKKLKIHSNERIDLADFEWGTSTYAEGVNSLNNKEVLLHDVGQIVSGFHIEVLDQVSFPGQLIVHNGTFINSDGKLVTNEETPFGNQTVTLLGANQTFYLELTHRDTNVDADNRAIWDPTYDNGVGNPPGREFIDYVTTRVSTIWVIKTPISTTSFTTGVPLAKITLDAFGRVTAVVNPGMELGPYATTLKDSVLAGATTFNVLDGLLLPNSGNITIGSEIKTINTIDQVAGIITTTTGVATALPAGTIVLGDSTQSFIKQKSGITGVHPDNAARLFKGDENRGQVLAASKYVAGGRNDLEIKSLKDQVDFLAFQIKELKAGSTTTAPVWGTSSRYYDFVGSVFGSRTFTYTIGNGTTSIGDYNGTTHAVFQSAIDAAIANGATTVRLFVKSGTYVFGGTVTCSANLHIEGENNSATGTVLQGGALVVPPLVSMSSNTAVLTVQNLRVESSQASAAFSVFYAAGTTATFYLERVTCSSVGTLVGGVSTCVLTCKMRDCNLAVSGASYVVRATTSTSIDLSDSLVTLTDTAQVVNGGAATTVYMRWYNVNVNKTGTSGTVLSITTLADSEFTRSTITSAHSSASSTVIIAVTVSNTSFEGLVINGSAAAAGTVTGFGITSATNVDFNGCRLVLSSAAPASHTGIRLGSGGSGTADIVNIIGCSFSIPLGSCISLANDSASVSILSNRFRTDGRSVSVIGNVHQGLRIIGNRNSSNVETVVVVDYNYYVFPNTITDIVIADNISTTITGSFALVRCLTTTGFAVTIANNQIRESLSLATANDSHCIAVQNMNEAKVLGNTIVGDSVVGDTSVSLGRRGVVFTDVSNIVCNNNTLYWVRTNSAVAKSNILINSVIPCRAIISGNYAYGATNGFAQTFTEANGGATTFVNATGNITYNNVQILGTLADYQGTATYLSSNTNSLNTNMYHS